MCEICRVSINRCRYLTSVLIRLIRWKPLCSKRVGRLNSAVDAICHSLNATPFARSKGGGRARERGGDGAREKRAKEVLTSRTISPSIFIVTILYWIEARNTREERKIKWTNKG